MWSANTVNIFRLPSAVPFASLTFQRLTLSCAVSQILKMNHWMAKSAWQKKTPCHRNGEKNLFGGLFLNGKLDSVENSTNYVAACEFPLALGHDMQKKKTKPHKKRNENTFYHFVPFRGPRSCVCYECHVSLLHSSHQHRCSRARSWMLTFCVSWM